MNDKVYERYYNRFNKFNTKVLQKLGETIKKFEGLTPTQAHILAEELKFGADLDELTQELSKITGKTVLDIKETLEDVAIENVEFAEVYYKARNMEYVPYKNQFTLQRFVNSIATQTGSTMVNIARTTGFTSKVNGRTVFKTLRQTYIDLIDEAVYNVSRGQQDYQSAMRSTIKQLANSGVKTIDYASGYSRRLDSSVRQVIMDGVSQVFDNIQQQIGDLLGTDGVEITAHELCALDHLPYQGRQYTNKEFEQLQNSLDRPIGTYNCRHMTYRIILGVDEPSYTKNQLNEYYKNSTKPINYDGKTYTKYEATQVQRKLETAIRRNKDAQILAKASGDTKMVNKAQQTINKLTDKYNDFSKTAGLQTYKERLSVSGYRSVKVK